MAVKRRLKISHEEWEHFRKLTLMDDDFMNLALEGNIPCVEEMLRVILKKEDLSVKKVQTQKFLKGFARSVYLDVYAVDNEGKLYNIEIQRENEGADPRRPRFHGAMLDTHALKAGQDFRELPERYVIFITRNDVLGVGRTAYVIHKYIEAGDKLLPFDDGTHLIYVNCAAKDDGTELWKLIHDLQCPDAGEMYFPRLAARVKFLKEEEEGKEKMSNYFEEQREKMRTYFEEREKKAVEAKAEATRKEDKQTFAMKLIQLGKVTLDEIAECTGLTLRQVKALAKAAAM